MEDTEKQSIIYMDAPDAAPKIEESDARKKIRADFDRAILRELFQNPAIESPGKISSTDPNLTYQLPSSPEGWEKCLVVLASSRLREREDIDIVYFDQEGLCPAFLGTFMQFCHDEAQDKNSYLGKHPLVKNLTKRFFRLPSIIAGKPQVMATWPKYIYVFLSYLQLGIAEFLTKNAHLVSEIQSDGMVKNIKNRVVSILHGEKTNGSFTVNTAANFPKPNELRDTLIAIRDVGS